MPDEEANMTDDESNDVLPALNKKMSHTLSIEKRTKKQVELESQPEPTLTSSPSERYIINTQSDEEHDVLSDDSPCLPNSKVKPISLEDLTRYSDTEVIQVVHEELGHDNMQVVSYGVQMIIINDYCGNFLPVFGISLSELFYQFGLTSNKMEGKTVLSSSISYFNALAGSWEPAMEHFNMSLNYKKGEDEMKDIQIDVDKELNINMSESLLKTIRDAVETYKASKQEAQVHVVFKDNGPHKHSKVNVSQLIDFDLMESVQEQEEDADDEESIDLRMSHHS